MVVFVDCAAYSTKAVVTIESTASKLKLKSSDSKVVSVGKVTKNAEGNFTAELTVKKAGYVELTATANGMTATVTVELVSELYTYTIYARSSDSSHMSSDSAALHIWDEAAGAGGRPQPHGVQYP